MDFDQDNGGIRNTSDPDNALDHGSDREDSENEMQGSTLPADHKSEEALGGQDLTSSSDSGDEELQAAAAAITADRDKGTLSSGASASANVENQFSWLDPATSTIPEEEGAIGINLGAAVSDAENSNDDSLTVRLQQVAECRAVAVQEREGHEELNRRIGQLEQDVLAVRNRERMEGTERAMLVELGEVRQLQYPSTEPRQFCDICNVSFNEDEQENHQYCQPDVRHISFEEQLRRERERQETEETVRGNRVDRMEREMQDAEVNSQQQLCFRNVEPRHFCNICNVSFNEHEQENHRYCQPDVCRTSLEEQLRERERQETEETVRGNRVDRMEREMQDAEVNSQQQLCFRNMEPQQHCEVCNVWFDDEEQENHLNCRPDDCCLCLEVLDPVISECHMLPCRHKVHTNCKEKLVRHGFQTCPLCGHPLSPL